MRCPGRAGTQRNSGNKLDAGQYAHWFRCLEAAACHHEADERVPRRSLLADNEELLAGIALETPRWRPSPPLNASQVGTLIAIRTSGARLLSLVNDLLDSASLRKQMLKINPKSINLASLVEEVAAVQNMLVRTGVKLTVSVPAETPLVTADPGRVAQILHNLVRPALRRAPPSLPLPERPKQSADCRRMPRNRSQLGNALKFTQRGYVNISADVNAFGTEVVVIVEDTGPGIPQDALERIFLPFEQGSAAINKKRAAPPSNNAA